MFFLFKHKTAYEMRISDWSSDVCSSDLDRALLHLRHELLAQEGEQRKAAQQRHESTDHYDPFACQRLLQQGLVDALDPCHPPGVLLLLGLEAQRGPYRDQTQAQKPRADHRDVDTDSHRLEHLAFEVIQPHPPQAHPETDSPCN